MSKRKIKPFECKKKQKVMTTIKELLQLMLDNKNQFEYGLCRWAINLRQRSRLIDSNELDIIMEYINKNRPIDYELPHYWKTGEIAPRIEWLKEHINK